MFSHESKVDLVREAEQAGYRTTLHVLIVPEDLAVARVGIRVAQGGHDVPEDKIRGRYARLWAYLRDAIEVADEAFVYDSSRAESVRRVATYVGGRLAGEPDWPAWTPDDLQGAGR